MLQALSELTIFGTRQTPATLGSSALFYPLVGLLLGTTWLATDYLTGGLVGRRAASAAVIIVSLVLTRGATARGFVDTSLEILSRAALTAGRQGSPSGAGGIALALVVLGLELLCLLEIERLRAAALLFAPTLGRWSMVVLAFGSREAREDGRRVKFAPNVTFREFGLTSTVTFLMVFAATEFLGVLVVGVAGLVTVGLRLLLHARLQGVTRASLGGACEATQLVCLALFALF
jgi:adenosylcobinamide-GDP ribazoletransferase